MNPVPPVASSPVVPEKRHETPRVPEFKKLKELLDEIHKQVEAKVKELQEGYDKDFVQVNKQRVDANLKPFPDSDKIKVSAEQMKAILLRILNATALTDAISAEFTDAYARQEDVPGRTVLADGSTKSNEGGTVIERVAGAAVIPNPIPAADPDPRLSVKPKP